VAAEGGPPVVGAGRGGREFARVDGAVFLDLFDGRDGSGHFAFAPFIGVELEVDRARAVGVDQAAQRGRVFVLRPHRHGRDGRGFVRRVFRVDDRGLPAVLPFAYTPLFRSVAAEGGPPVVGAGRGGREFARVDGAVFLD